MKRDLYLRHGVREYRIADPDERTIELLARVRDAWRPHAVFDEADTLPSPLLEALRLPVREVFE